MRLKTATCKKTSFLTRAISENHEAQYHKSQPLKILIFLKYIKMWSGFPLMRVYLSISPKFLVSKVGAKWYGPDGAPKRRKTEEQLEE